MKKTFYYLGIIILFTRMLVSCKPEITMNDKKHFEPPVSFEEATHWADSMVNLMTLEEKITMIGGDRIFFTQALPRLGIPAVMTADATQGVHLRDKWRDSIVYEQVLPKSTAFPSPILLAWQKRK